MTAPEAWLSIVGIGEDGIAGLSPAARERIAQADLVVGGRRHLALVADLVAGLTLVWPSPPQAAFPQIKARRFSPVCVLASGDPFFYGIGSSLAREVPIGEMKCLPAPSAFSLAAARLGWPLQDCALVSLHGRRLERIIPHLQPGAQVLALSWDGGTGGRLAQLLVGLELGETRMIVCEAMGGPRERLRTARARDFVFGDIDPLNLLALELPAEAGPRAMPRAPGLSDDWFEHDGQLTKREIRAVTLAALGPRQRELLWDVGAGAGSIAIEWMLSDSSNRAVAIERDEARAARIDRNAVSLGVPDLRVVRAPAPAAFAGLPQPDAIFIGGGASDPLIVETAWSALRAGGRIVANAVTLAGQSQLFETFKRFGGDLRMVQVSRADRVGSYDALRPERSVVQWTGRKR